MSHPPHEDREGHDGHGSRSETAFDEDVLGLGDVRDHDESLADDVLEHEEHLYRQPRRRRNPLLVVVSLLVAGALVVTASVFALGWVRDVLPVGSVGEPTAAQDYEGPGTGEVLVVVPPGAGGGEIAELLVENDVVASSSAFTAELQADPRSSSIQPGTYRMANQMSSEAALARLLDGSYREIDGVTIREGLWVAETFEELARSTGHDVADYEAVDPATLDLPDAAEGELEGFLYPSTYEFGPETTPQDQLQALIDQGRRVHADLGVPEDELREVIIKASIVQGEGMFAEDLPKIARVMENRLEGASETAGRMQMDSTIHFIFQERGLAGTTDAQRADPSPYNTYENPGLPPGPINSPGADAIEAVLNPAPGDWLYFVTVDPSTGETNFAETYEEHLENQQLFLEWCSENPDQC